MSARAVTTTAKVTKAVRAKASAEPESKQKPMVKKSGTAVRQIAAKTPLQAKPKAGTGKAKTCAPVASASADHAAVAHRIHALLHTMHQIERYEERLCSMQDAIKRSGKVSAALLRDLQSVLEEIPSEDYLHDLEAVRDLIAA